MQQQYCGMDGYYWNLLQKYSGVPETGGNGNVDTAQERSRLARYGVPASGQADDRWVITSADTNFWNFLVSFIASLRDVAHYKGHIGVIDYGLTPPQSSALRDFGTAIIKPQNKHALIIDRYFTTAEYFAGNADAAIYYFDADMWFTEPFDELFENKDIHNGHLAAAKDVWECDYYYTCAPEKHHRVIQRMLEEVIGDYGQSLQAGHVAGSSGAWLRFTDLMKMMLKKGFAVNRWGTDALALNFYSTLFKEQFTLLPITYNAPPAWGLEIRNNRFYATNFKYDNLHKPEDGPVLIKAIHRTFPFRGPNRQEHLAFENVHPGLFRRWCGLLGDSAENFDSDRFRRKKEINFHVLLWGVGPYHKKLQILIESQQCLRTAEKYNITPEIIGLGYDGGDGPKAILSHSRFYILEEKLKAISDDDIVVVMDSFDTLFCGSESEIIRKFKLFNTEILFSAQRCCSCQWVEYQKKYGAVSGPGKYLHAGAYIGYAHALRSFVEECIARTTTGRYKNVFDVAVMGAYLHEHFFQKEKYQIDNNCEVFWVTTMDPPVEFKNNKLYSSTTNTCPTILHIIGGKKERKNDYLNCFNHIMEKLP